ncbi:hypothetical protein PENTCL1PPCAC_15112 [Pristionchus entomophagus]|uniref:TNFR-Cys domain-containing protein n=1 Tax=Pristionchus entomophagus TaxID=358040 RepID=A0AAV5TBK7_9BILA|nr:hypothetical protein PENTCL1PPCAC_15112 [Pristionchus entomophagus]
MHATTLILCTSSLLLVSADYSQEDCQLNEIFVKCGQCEGTCANPRPVCESKCRGERCECIAKRGFVRSKHGHCIRCKDCPGPSIYSEDPSVLSRDSAHMQFIPESRVTTPKPMMTPPSICYPVLHYADAYPVYRRPELRRLNQVPLFFPFYYTPAQNAYPLYPTGRQFRGASMISHL